MKQIYKSNHGFSLVEVMVGGAILAGVGLAGAMMFKDQRFAQKKIEHDQTLMTFHNSLTKMMANTSNCNATFKAFGFQNAAPIGDISGFYRCNVASGTCTTGTDASSVTPEAAAFLSELQYIDPTEVWQVTSITTPVQTATSTTGPLKLKVDYQMNPKIGSKRVTKELTVGVRFTKPLLLPQVFKECYDPQESAVNSLQNELCASFASNTVAVNAVATWDETQQKCVLNTALNVQCPVRGQVVAGIAADGTVSCVNALQGYDPAPIINATLTTCNGANAKVVIVGGKVTVQCF